MTKTLFDENLTYKEAVELIKNGADVNARDWFKRTPLHMLDNIEVAELLVFKGAKVNAQYIIGKSPIFYHSRIQKIKFFIDSGANINITNSKGENILSQTTYF